MIRQGVHLVQHLNLLQHCCTIADFISLCEPNACGGFLRACFACRERIFYLYEFTELNFLSVGSQLPRRTLNTLID